MRKMTFVAPFAVRLVVEIVDQAFGADSFAGNAFFIDVEHVIIVVMFRRFGGRSGVGRFTVATAAASATATTATTTGLAVFVAFQFGTIAPFGRRLARFDGAELGIGFTV